MIKPLEVITIIGGTAGGTNGQTKVFQEVLAELKTSTLPDCDVSSAKVAPFVVINYN